MHKSMATRASICILLFAFFTILTSVHAFELDAPKTLFVHENTTIHLLDTNNEVYDVKIFIGDASKPSSRIFSSREGWKDARYYLLAALPDQVDFIIQPLQASEATQLCARLRKPSSSSYRQECVSIRIENRTQNLYDIPIVPTSSPSAQQLQPLQPLPSLPILLISKNSSPSSPPSSLTFSSRGARVEQGILIATILVILIGILLLLRRKQHRLLCVKISP